MPFGASQTAGIGSTTQDGWRKLLFNQLVDDGYKVSFVGTQHYGSIPKPDNACEAFPGDTIGAAYAKTVNDSSFTTYRPNVVIQTLGTNNCFHSDADLAYNQTLDALKGIRSKLPNTVVLVAGVTALVKDSHDCISGVNAQIQKAVKAQNGLGQPVHFVDLYNVLNKTTDYYKDGIHPNDGGYVKLFHTWYDALKKYGAEITQPLPLA